MKLHLPVFLRKAILALMLAYGVPALHAANLTLGAADSLSVDYSASGSLQDLNNGTLRLSGGTTLQPSSCGEGDGKTYTLLTGVSELLDAQGNVISLDSTNNAASRYFDATQPGTGFWADGTLQQNHGALQLVLHNETVKDAITITTRQVNPSAYQYYAGVSFENIEYAVGSYAEGGAIYGDEDRTITLSNNGSVTFSGNTASAYSSYSSYYYSDSSAYGGAIYGGENSTITLSNNGSVSFIGNTASSSDDDAYGGAIYGDYYGSTITLSDNGSVTFSGNTASAFDSACGGAISGYSSTITLSNNGSVIFSGNTAHSEDFFASGGAIHTLGDLSIRNNDSVEFYQNAEVENGTYRLRSIYAYCDSGDEISLSAAAWKSITFYDSVYIGSDATVNLNQDYTYQAENGSYVTIRQQGDIIFTGKHTEQHLNDLMEAADAGRTATAAEIRLSRTTVVNAMTNLYGGRLRVEEGAIYQGQGITAMEGSGATVRVQNATLSHKGYDLTFNAGTTLELVGTNIIIGNVQMLEGSILSFDASETTGQIWVDGDMFISGTLTIDNADTRSGENALLFLVSGNVTGWDEANITVMGQNTVTLVDNDIVLNYNAETYNKYVNGNVTYTSGPQVAGWYYCYEAISFENITSSSSGSAIYGGENSTITLSDNGSVIFSGNTASASSSSAYGGAIYGDYDSTITLSDNGSVVFEGNSASASSSSAAYGGAIYGGSSSTITLSNNGSVVFKGNTASASSYAFGGAIYGGSSSTITLSDNGSVSFSGNTASASSSSYAEGGAIYGAGDISLSNNGSVSFSGNTAYGSSLAEGGAIYGGGDITLNNNVIVSFSGNTASASSAYGGAIYGYGDSTITLSNNGSVVFEGNRAASHSSSYAEGGAIYGGGDSTITLSDNGSVVFEGNTASSSDSFARGGAIYGGSSSTITLSNNGSVTFSGNTAESASSSYYYSAAGGAIYEGSSSTITLSNNGSVSFSGNTASGSSSAYGGAIHGGSSSTITLSDNGSVSFSGNTASASSSAYGGAIYGGSSSTITPSNNGSVVFEGNTASASSSAYGGAIYGDEDSTITLSNNGSVVFEGNTASASSSAYGGAIYGDEDSTITLSNNGSVSFSGNTASASSSSASDSYAYGGAIYGGYDSTITLSDNESVTFSGNRAESSSSSSYGGAIYGSVTTEGNGDVTFSGNTASGSSAKGGAIYGSYYDSDITVNNNGSVTFSGNRAESSSSSAYGGAIYTYGNLSIRNNESVEFYQNAEANDGVYRLRSLYAGGGGDVISLSAAEGKSIEFQDSIYIDRGSTFNLNADYTDAENKVHQQHGDILFTGKYTETHLNELLAADEAGRTATAEEILNSSTTEVQSMTNLYGGRLRVEDGAIYKGYGVTAHEGSSATVLVKNAELQHKGYDLTFHAGTTLELAGNNTISGNVLLQEGCTLCFDGSETKGLTKLTGSLSFTDGTNISLQNGSNRPGQNEILLYVNGAVSGWDDSYLGDNSDIRWVNGDLIVLNYNEETFKPLFNGDSLFTSRQTGNVKFRYYNSLRFDNLSYSNDGGAIYGSNRDITVNNNGSVTFSGNSSSDGRGGAIYGYSSTITLSDNESVTFSGNSSSDGGAIYGSNRDITVNNNGSVTFSGNRAESSSSSAYGGAIYTYGNLSIRNNESVEFYQNAEANDGVYRLRGLYAGGGWDVISLSAAEGKSIEFRDSVYIASGSTFNLNEDYTDTAGVVHKQAGDIIFTGATTEDDLYTVKGNVAGTEEEIQLSRTTEVNTMTNLYGGRLRVEEGAIYMGRGITAMEGSAATVRVQNATLSHSGYDLTFNAGTTLELVGDNTITGNVQMLSDSNLVLDFESGMGEVYIQGDLSVSGSLIIKLPSVDNCYDTNTILLQVEGKCTDLMESRLAIQSDYYTVDDLFWENNYLVINYDENTFNPFFNGSVTYSEQMTGVIGLSYFELLGFSLPSELEVSAILSDKVTLRNNGSIKFSDNTVAVSRSVSGGVVTCGAAISGQRIGGNVVLDGNREVLFERNIAGGRGAAEGGAIFNLGNSISGNERVVFNENAAIADSSWSAGGAIRGNLSLVRNKEVIFSGNKAQSGVSSAEGGAIFGWDLQLNENESLSFTSNAAIVTSSDSNSAVTTGGAIYALQNAVGPYVDNRCLSICNNGSVLFAKNYELNKGNYRLRSIYVSDNGEGCVLISAAQGKRVEFRDSVYIGSENTLLLNADYTDAAENTTRQTGDIIFTGFTTEEDLYTVKNNVAGTDAEIIASRTTEIKTLTELYGGRLRVEDGAIYKGYGITATADSGAVVRLRNASLQHTGYSMTFLRGTGMSLRGINTSSGSLVMEADSTLTFDISADNLVTAVLSHTGSLSLDGSVTLNVGSSDTHLAYGQYKLLQVTDLGVLGNGGNVNQHVGEGSYNASDFEWVDNTLCFNYSGQQLSELPLFSEITDTPVTPDEPEIPDTPVTPDEPEIPDTPVTPDEPEIPDTPVTPEKPEGNKTVRPSGNTISTSEVTSNSKLVLEGKGTLTLNGKVSPASISVNISKNLTLKGAKTGGALAGDGDLTKKGNGTLSLNDGNGSWTGDTHLLAGTIKVKGTTSLGKGDVYVKGGTLHLGFKAIGNDIVQEKSAAIKSGKKFTGTYTLESGELQKGSTLNISKTATLAGGTVNGTLSGSGKTEVTGNVKLGDKGKITTKALTLGEDATLTTSAKGLSSKTTTLSIGEDATMSLGGKMTVASVKMNGGTLKTTASKPAAMTVKNDMELTDAVLSTNGKVTTNKLILNDSTMSIKGAKAQNLTVKQNLTIGSGSALTLNGKLSTGSLTIKSGGMLTMSGSKPVTLKVKGALTLNEGSSIIMNYSFVQGKTYKLLTFKSYNGTQDFYSIFGVEADDCTITNTGKALTLTVNTKWKPQTQQKAVSADAATPIVVAKPQSSPVADALVQANWGQLEASRAFVNAMANRSMAVQLGNGERAVWASAIGSSSRHDTASGHNGADTNVSGGAFGLETQVGRASLFGMALGNSWTRVSAHGFGTIEQDTTHLGLYGQTNWRSGVTADWSAAYGRSESESMGSDWNQKHLQLDGRVSYNHELNANAVLSPFAGVQYYASDSAAIGSTDTGSLQNLRAEIGVAASHRVGKFGVYGEIALHQDLARNNPTVSMEGMRYNGMNPGRTGINFTIGASYELNNKWSVNASYTGEFVENANAHSANVGASYKF